MKFPFYQLVRMKLDWMYVARREGATMFPKMSGIIGAILLVIGVGLFSYLVLASPVRGAAPTQNYGELICGSDSNCQITAR